jgi:hypothetical protein
MFNPIPVLMAAFIAVDPSPAIGFGEIRWYCPRHKSSAKTALPCIIRFIKVENSTFILKNGLALFS